jgi:phosphate transport system ATP-binding protein
MQQATRVSDLTAFFNLDGVGQPGHLVEFGETEKIFKAPQQEEAKKYVSGEFG